MAKLFNRAKMTTATTGTGTITLGSASIGFQTFASAGVASGDVVQYVIEEGGSFEIGTGTYTATGTTLTRSPTESSNAGAAISLLGNATVSVTAINEDYSRLQFEGATKASAHSTGVTFTGVVSATSFSGDGSALTGIEGVPSGVITLWSGSTASIPAGWVICDGLNSTPDLRDRFIVGAGSTYAVAATGGSNTVALAEANLPSHTHTFSGNADSAGSHAHTGNISNVGNHTHNGYTSTIGNHTHSINASDGGGNQWAPEKGSGGNYPVNTNAGGSHSHNVATYGSGAHGHTVSINAAGAHTHTLTGTIGNTGSGTAHENRPPYYALAYIMKT